MQEKATIYSDGGSRGNPGEAAIGAVIKLSNKSQIEISKPIGVTTNNIAEYRAVYEALKILAIKINKSKSKKTIVQCYLDSELAVKQLNREYKVKNPKILEFFIKINNKVTEFQRVDFHHIPREKNKAADKLVNLALDKLIKK